MWYLLSIFFVIYVETGLCTNVLTQLIRQGFSLGYSQSRFPCVVILLRSSCNLLGDFSFQFELDSMIRWDPHLTRVTPSYLQGLCSIVDTVAPCVGLMGLQVAQEYDARIALIHAVEDEETMCLGDALGTQMADKDGTKLAGNIESRTTKHHEAIFAPTDLFSRSDGPPVGTTTTPSTVGSEVSGGATGAAFTSPGVVGAAIRTRLALKGKSHAPKIDNRSQDKSRVGSAVKSQSLSQVNEDQEGGPLFKALKVCSCKRILREQQLFSLARRTPH